MEDVEARFAHLLLPIRDLTRNWEVDVAAQLGEYLEELDQICISFDKGKTTMNFIEAALLIQGSACVYSKKVEYLYSLVYQALDFISGKKQAKQLSSKPEDGTVGDASSRAPQEAEQKFLALDDLSDSCANVDLRGDQVLSGTLIPLLPNALVAPDEMEKNSNPLYSCQGEVLASRKDFRVNTCTPHPRGTFLLEPVGASLMEALQPRNPKEPGRAEEQPMEVSVCGSPGPALSISREPGSSPEGLAPRGGGMGEDEEDAEGVAEPPEASEPEVLMEPPEPRSPEQSAAQPRRCTLRERKEALEPASRLKDTPDPWQGLDPFDSPDSKPFRKGRPYSVPPRVEEAPGQKRKRKGAVKLQDFHQWYLAAYADHADSRRSRRKGPSFADMEVLYWKHVKEQLETLRKMQRREAAERWLPRAEQGLWPVEEDRLEDSVEDLGAADDFLEPEEYAEPEGAEPGDDADMEAEAMPASLRYEELVQKNVVGPGALRHHLEAGRLHHHLEAGARPGDRAEAAHQGLGGRYPDPAPGAGGARALRHPHLRGPGGLPLQPAQPVVPLRQAGGGPACLRSVSLHAGLPAAGQRLHSGDHPAAGTGGGCGYHGPEAAHTPEGPQALPDLRRPLHSAALSGGAAARAGPQSPAPADTACASARFAFLPGWPSLIKCCHPTSPLKNKNLYRTVVCRGDGCLSPAPQEATRPPAPFPPWPQGLLVQISRTGLRHSLLMTRISTGRCGRQPCGAARCLRSARPTWPCCSSP